MTEAQPPDPEPVEGTGAPTEAPPRRPRQWSRWTRRAGVLVLAVVASILVSFFTIDIGRIRVGGSSLETLIEREASKFLERPMRLSAVRAHVRPGRFIFEDLVIEGPTPQSRPFFAAKRITVDVPWWTLFRRELHVEVRLDGWSMSVEQGPDGTRLPRLTRRGGSSGPSPFKVRRLWVAAYDGEFIYQDHLTPWSVVARNLQFDLVRANTLDTYVGTARFRDGTVTIQDHVPMRTDFDTRFQLLGSLVRLHHIDLLTDGARSHVSGFVDFGNWPSQEYRVDSTVDFPRMRELFFARESWRLSGEGRFRGVFTIRKDEGHELAGEFRSDEAGLRLGRGEWLFPDLHGALVWNRREFRVTHADSGMLGGGMRLAYGIAPLGAGGATATLTAEYRDLDLHGVTRQFGWTALQPQGRLTGRVEMAWPNGRFRQGLQGHGESTIVPPEGQAIATPVLDPDAPAVDPEGTFVKNRAYAPFALGADTRYRFTGGSLDFDESWAATPTTFVRFAGHAIGGDANLPFHVTSHDWQDSDRLFAAIMTNFASETGAIEVGGRGTFDGVLTKSFGAPRIEGEFSGDRMRAWNVDWGRATGRLAIENGYMDLRDGRIDHERGGRILTSGRFALGYPRADGGEEINATVQVEDVPLATLRRAFELDDWPVDGQVALATLALRGGYERLTGDGRMRLERGTAWDERFDHAESDLVFEGDGSLRLRRMEMVKGGGSVSGDAWISWADSAYSFSALGRGIDVRHVQMLENDWVPLTGQLGFKATGASGFDDPAWQFDWQIADLYADDEGIGAVRGRFTLTNNVLRLDDIVVASDRLQVSCLGNVAMNEASDGNIHCRLLQSSLDPYLKFVAQELPYTRAIASGSVSVSGPFADAAQLDVDVRVDDAALTLFDYALRNDGQIRMRLRNNVFTLEDVKFQGENTRLSLTGDVNGTTRMSNLGATGQASLAVLQAFYPELSASGGATVSANLTGSFDALQLTGQAQIADGRLRHFSVPHALTQINGPIRMEEGRITVDGLRGVMGEGAVTFGGAILLDGYTPVEYDLNAIGLSMNLRVPDGLVSTVNATLALRGPIGRPVLSGDVDVLRAAYQLRVDPENYFGLAGGLDAGGPVASGPLPAAAEIPFGLAIRIRAPVLPFIDNRTATIYGSADVEIGGTLDRPIITGRIDLDRGEWSFSGNRYRLLSGSIDFTNPLAFDPFFEVLAETRARTTGQNYVVTIRLSGTLDRIDPSINSDPWLPEAQVISLLLGESPDVGAAELRARSSPQELQAQALRTAGFAILTSPISATVGSVVESVTTIDTVQIVPLLGNEATLQQLTPTARVTLGKRLSDRLYLTYSRTLSGLQNEVILIEFDQNDQVTWVFSRNEDRSFALDFRIRHVFR